MTEKTNFETLIARYLNGNCTSEEQLKLHTWINESPDNKLEYLELKEIWDIARPPKSFQEDQLILFYKNQYEKSNQSRLFWLRFSLAAAAILTIGLIISLLMPIGRSAKSGNLQVFSVPLGSRSKLLLADGTLVNLNSGSELKYSSDFTGNNRVVSLSGEAFFKVKSDKEHPFIVKTDDFEVKVTGTEFNVCSYEENNYISTTLAEGIVELKINGSNQNLSIKPGEKFEINRQTKEFRLVDADIEAETSWKDGEFIFRNIPFNDLVKRLERWYDVKLNYSDNALKNYAYTGRFKNQETIWQVLDALKLMSPIDYRKTTFREFTIVYKPIKIR